MTEQPKQTIRGRGTAANLPNRFEPISFEPDGDWLDEEQPSVTTKFFKDASKTIISYNNSPDIRFDASINPYRGCEHGCVYCYARPTHEYLGLSAGLDFETQILVKHDAPQLLRKELAAKKWVPQALGISGVTDCYQPIERKLKLTRQCLEVLLDFRNPGLIVTKNQLITRDTDVLQELAQYKCICVFISLSSLRDDLVKVLEPRTSRPHARLKAMRELSQAGIPVGLMLAPVIPGLNDHEIPAVIEAASEAGVDFASYIMLRLPYAVKDIFSRFMQDHYPTMENKVINRIKHMRGGKLNIAEFGKRFRGEGIFADQTDKMFKAIISKEGLNKYSPPISTEYFRIPPVETDQTMLW